MAKNTIKNEHDGMIFQSKKDLEYYIHLKQLKENELIHHFSLDQYVDEKSNVTKHRAKPLSIDDYLFQSKTEADYYLNLKQLQHTQIIQSFSLAWMRQNADEKSKYLAKKVEIDGHLFDSKTEADYYIHLLIEKEKGHIQNFELQPTFELQPSFKKNGKHYRKIEYIADFEVFHFDGKIEVIDVKGMITPEFSLKQKLFEYRFPEKELVLMKFVEKYGGWVTFDEWKAYKKKDKKKT